MLEKFKETSSCDEIHSILKSTRTDETIVWQNDGEDRHVFSLRYFKYFESIQTLEMHLRDYDDSLKVDETIYIKLSHRNAIFKGHVVNIENDVLTLYVPTTVRAIDTRAVERVEIDVRSNKVLSLLVGRRDKPSQVRELDFIVTSLSPQGMCIVISDNNKPLFENSDLVELSKLGEEVLPKTIGVKQRWIQRYRYREGGKLKVAYRSGFEFREKLLNEFIGRFLR